MNWWLFLQLIILIILLALVISATIESAFRVLYKCRAENTAAEDERRGLVRRRV